MVRAGLIIQSRAMMTAPVTPSLLLAVSAALLLSGMGSTSTPPDALPPQSAAIDGISYWHGDDLSGAPSVRISLSEQRAYFYRGGQLAGMSLISSGREGLDTVTGDYHILQKDAVHRSSLFGNYVDAEGMVVQRDVDTRKDTRPSAAHFVGADMPYWMRLTAGTGMHEGFLPGYPASHGCIRMPDAMAKAFFQSVSVGTPVSIQP